MVKEYTEEEISAMDPEDREIFEEELRKIKIKREMHTMVDIKVPDKEKAPGWRSRLWSAVKTAAVVLPTAYLAHKALGYAYTPAVPTREQFMQELNKIDFDVLLNNSRRRIEEIERRQKRITREINAEYESPVGKILSSIF